MIFISSGTYLVYALVNEESAELRLNAVEIVILFFSIVLSTFSFSHVTEVWG
jgi:hypothetical protein